MTESGSKCRNLHTDNVTVVDTGKRLKRATTVLKLAYTNLISNGFSHSNELDMSIVAICCKGGPDTLAMLQLATNSRFWLFDCVKLDATLVCEKLKWVLESPHIQKLAHDIQCDVYALIQQHGIHPVIFLDAQLGHEIDHRSQIQVSLAKLLEKYELKHTTNDSVHSAMEGNPKYWSKRPLASRAIQYAEADVNLLLKMGQQMVAHLSGALSSDNNETKLSVVLRASSLRVLYVAKSKSRVVVKTPLSEKFARAMANTVNLLIVDTSNEIAGDGTTPHHCIGLARRVQVPDLAAQGRVTVECVQNHIPSVMVIDKIGRPCEVASARTVKQRGVRIVASAHGDMRKLSKNAQLSGILGDKQSSILSGGIPTTNRVSDPIFDTIIELRPENWHEWVIVMDTANAVDNILLKVNYPVQSRIRDADTGRVSIRFERG